MKDFYATKDVYGIYITYASQQPTSLIPDRVLASIRLDNVRDFLSQIEVDALRSGSVAEYSFNSGIGANQALMSLFN